MEWLLLAALGIMWAAFLVPSGAGRSEAHRSIDFERRMELLANAEVHGTTGRWIVTRARGFGSSAPTSGTAHVPANAGGGSSSSCWRRSCLTFLIGLVPPLRPMWSAPPRWERSDPLRVAALLSAIKARARPAPSRPRDRQRALAAAPSASRRRGPTADARHDRRSTGWTASATGEPVHVVVRTARPASEPRVDLDRPRRTRSTIASTRRPPHARRRCRQPDVRSAHPRTRSVRSIAASSNGSRADRRLASGARRRHRRRRRHIRTCGSRATSRMRRRSTPRRTSPSRWSSGERPSRAGGARRRRRAVPERDGRGDRRGSASHPRSAAGR